MSLTPVFLKAIPRSGGTLFVTILDAHPLIAMSYEIYEDGLIGEGKIPLSIENLIDKLNRLKIGKVDDTKIIKKLDEPNFRTFLYRARRGGLELMEIFQQLELFSKSGGNFFSEDGRLNFIDMLMRLKMHKSGKRVWGGKTQANLDKLNQRHSDACFFIMIRDIRDVFSSMCNTGSFKFTAEEAANLWKSRILDFQNFASNNSQRAMVIRYDKLVNDPENVLKRVCSLIGVEYAPEMINFHKKNLSLFKNPHGHLSMEQIRKGLNTESVGRWKRDLNMQDLEIISKIAGRLLDDWL